MINLKRKNSETKETALDLEISESDGIVSYKLFEKKKEIKSSWEISSNVNFQVDWWHATAGESC